MSEFPSTAEEFYALRDDRTNRCITTRDYQRVGCVVCLAPEHAATANGQTMLLVAANLLTRWCRRGLPRRRPGLQNRRRHAAGAVAPRRRVRRVPSRMVG